MTENEKTLLLEEFQDRKGEIPGNHITGGHFPSRNSIFEFHYEQNKQLRLIIETRLDGHVINHKI